MIPCAISATTVMILLVFKSISSLFQFSPKRTSSLKCANSGANVPRGKTIIVSEHRLYYLRGLADRFIYMGDRWTPENAIDGRYIWLPIRFEGEQPVIEWQSEWSY